MLHYSRIDLNEVTDADKNNNSKEHRVCQYCFFIYALKFQDSVCNGYHDLTMQCLDISEFAITAVKGVNYCYSIHDITNSKAINLLKNYVLDDPSYI